LLATVSADAGKRAEVIQLVSVFGGRIVDVGHDALMVMLAGAPDVLDDFEELIRPYNIVELQRTGRVALGRLSPGAGAAGSGAGDGAAGSSAAAGGTVLRVESA
jgi:acetolactate synthase-1/3 small subunit